MRLKCPRCKTVNSVDKTTGGGGFHCSSCGARLHIPSKHSTSTTHSIPQEASHSSAANPAESEPKQGTQSSPVEQAPLAAVTPEEASRPLPVAEGPTASTNPPNNPGQKDEPEKPQNEEGEDEKQPDEEEKSRSSHSRGRYKVKPYKAEWGINRPGLVAMFGLPLLAGAFFGLLASLIGQLFYLIGIFPIVIGIGIGVVAYFGVRMGKVRHPVVIGAACFLAGWLAMFSEHYFDYLRFSQIETVNGQAPLSDALKGIPDELRETLKESFLDYLDFTAQQGVSIARGSFGSLGFINLGYVGTYIYWFVEVLMVAGISWLCAVRAAVEPFCRHCSTWKQLRKVGCIDTEKAEKAIELIQEGAIRWLVPVEEKDGVFRLQAFLCPHCLQHSSVVIRLERVIKKDQAEEAEALTLVSYPGESLRTLCRLFPAADLGDAATQKHEGKKRRKHRRSSRERDG